MAGLVGNNEDLDRFEVEVDGLTAFLDYRLEGDRLVLVHTEVPAALGGRGIGGRLAQGALDFAVGRGLAVSPVCPFVRSYLERHPDEAARVRLEDASDLG